MDTSQINIVLIFGHMNLVLQIFFCVDDFGVKYLTKDDAQHLITNLQRSYDITIDYSGRNFCGLDIE